MAYAGSSIECCFSKRWAILKCNLQEGLDSTFVSASWLLAKLVAQLITLTAAFIL